MHYEEAHEHFKNEFRRLSYTQTVPGMDREDIESEMFVVLWKACKIHDEGTGTLGTLWWSMWCNKRKNLLRSYYAQKRVRLLPVETLPEVVRMPEDLFESPQGDIEEAIWTKLAQGDTPTEVRRDLGLNTRQYYKAVRSWKTPGVYAYLTTGLAEVAREA